MKIFWDLDNHEFVKSLTSPQQVQSLSFVCRDRVPLTLYTVRPSTDPGIYYKAEDVPAGQSVIWGIKPYTKAGLDGAYLADQLVWTRTALGTYQATISLKTTPMINALTDVSVDLLMEFTLVDVDGENYDSTQMPITVDLDLNREGDAEAVGVAAAINSICREELIAGNKVLILYNSDGVEYWRFNPPGA
jgi:hypothetical protein